MLPLQQELLVVAVPVSGHNAGVNGHRAGGPGLVSVLHGFAFPGRLRCAAVSHSRSLGPKTPATLG